MQTHRNAAYQRPHTQIAVAAATCARPETTSTLPIGESAGGFARLTEPRTERIGPRAMETDTKMDYTA